MLIVTSLLAKSSSANAGLSPPVSKSGGLFFSIWKACRGTQRTFDPHTQFRRRSQLCRLADLNLWFGAAAEADQVALPHEQSRVQPHLFAPAWKERDEWILDGVSKPWFSLQCNKLLTCHHADQQATHDGDQCPHQGQVEVRQGVPGVRQVRPATEVQRKPHVLFPSFEGLVCNVLYLNICW